MQPLSPQPSPEHLEVHRVALTGHCYRMLGSVVEAEDAVQETLVRAWRGLGGFDGRSSLKTWLYRIATRVCLDARSGRERRVRPRDDGPMGTLVEELVALPRSHWLEPIPDVAALPVDGSPAELLALRQSIRLAFVAALQHLPPRQRAALLLTEVLGWSVAEVASALDTTPAAINSALQRARATLATRPAPSGQVPLSAEQHGVVEQFVAAFERYDMERLAALLTEDVVLSMPPYTLWLQGRGDVVAWMEGRGAGCRGSVLVPTAACGSPAFGQYRHGGEQPWALVVLELAGPTITSLTYFLDTAEWFPRFGLPPRWEGPGAA